jgi:hypothetical protein
MRSPPAWAGEQDTGFPVVSQRALNMKAAKAPGLDVPPTLLALADDVIE